MNEHFVKNSNGENNEGYFPEVDLRYPEKLHELHNDLPFLQQRSKIKKFEKIVTNLHDRTEYVIHIKNLKQELNNRPILKKSSLSD